MTDNKPIEPPAEAELAPFRVCAAAVASSEEAGMAFSEAATEIMSNAMALCAQEAMIGWSWAAMAGEMLAAGAPPAPAHDEAGRQDPGSEDHLEEDAMRVSECMTREVQLAAPNDTIAEAAQAMAQLDAGVLPVSENDRLVGMITDRDIAVRAVALGLGPDALVADVMNAEVKYCFDDQEIDDVLRNMGEQQLRRMPVLNHDKRLVGIVSLADLATNGEARQAGDALCDISRPGGQHSQSAN